MKKILSAGLLALETTAGCVYYNIVPQPSLEVGEETRAVSDLREECWDKVELAIMRAVIQCGNGRVDANKSEENSSACRIAKKAMQDQANECSKL